MAFYRLAKPASAWFNVLKTLVVVALGWTLVWALPTAVAELHHMSDELADLYFTEQKTAGLIVLGASSFLALWSALMLAVVGNGTPFPMDAPRRLVMSGPYAWLRNPMVTATVGQGAGLGLYTGSLVVVLLVVLGAILWNLVVRPAEEDHLQKVFGRDFELYRRSVRCWLPMHRRWSPPPKTGPISLDDLPAEGSRRRRRR